jgi:hypothetical protein
VTGDIGANTEARTESKNLPEIKAQSTCPNQFRSFTKLPPIPARSINFYNSTAHRVLLQNRTVTEMVRRFLIFVT